MNHNPEAIGFLFNQLRLTGDEPALLLQQYLDIASNALSSEALKFLCTQLIPHSLSVISQAANSIAIKLIDGMLILRSGTKQWHRNMICCIAAMFWHL